MSDVARAILYAVNEAGLALPEPVLVINDYVHDLKAQFPNAEFWSPELDAMLAAKNYKSVILFTPKQKEESRYLAAFAFGLLDKDGVLVAAATNESGGKTLAKQLVGFGVKVTDISKHKCRVVWTTEPHRAADVMIHEALDKGGIQKRKDGLWAQPGLFSWDRLDKGTDVLLHHLPFSLAGKGADFGCGIGIIGLKLLQRYKNIEKLTCVDRDIRALECCAKNLESFDARVQTRQADLTKPIDLANLDFIVMNPPFHTGKKQSIAMGQAFISNAARCLKTGGILVFVANSHLPYEVTVAESFAFHRILSQEHGFKIIEAVK